MPPPANNVVQTCIAVALVMTMRRGVACIPRARRATRFLSIAALLLAATTPFDCADSVLAAAHGARAVRIAVLAASVVLELSAMGYVIAATVYVIRALRPPRPPRRRCGTSIPRAGLAAAAAG
ncbi:MAG TPA: hypothetical protein VN193_02915 [Candidatus Angelobacter sp.]|jgi:hypothetical protein|nr:hypothetical protein [Candidatus Angelobacter sp.]